MKKPITLAAALLLMTSAAFAQETKSDPNAPVPPAEKIREVNKSELDAAVGKVKPALVRIKVVEPGYYEGREEKNIAFGSGTIISVLLMMPSVTDWEMASGLPSAIT